MTGLMPGLAEGNPALCASLECAVPLHIAELAGTTFRYRAERAAEASQVIAERGDVLQFGGREGQAADVFNHLARGLAALAYQPGGVTFAGLHWEAAEPA